MCILSYKQEANMIDDLQYICVYTVRWGGESVSASKTATGDIGLLLYYIGVLRGPQAFFRFYRYPALATTAIALEGSMWFVPLLGILRDA